MLSFGHHYKIIIEIDGADVARTDYYSLLDIFGPCSCYKHRRQTHFNI